MLRKLVLAYLDRRFGRIPDAYDVVTCKTCGTETAFPWQSQYDQDPYNRSGEFPMWDYIEEHHDPKSHDVDWQTFYIERA